VWVWNDEMEVIIQDVAEAFAHRARAARIVERKEERRRALKDTATGQAVKLIAQPPGALPDDLDQRHATPFDERCLQRLR
jgi:hypothetical protein